MTEAQHSETLDLPRGIALAWGVAAAPQRGPKREMSVERIVEAAVELADADGLGAVSMAAVAKRLGFTPMSLYRYVSAKDDLLLLMQEEATGLPPESYRAAATWREALEALFTGQVEIYLRHPWMLSLPISGAPTTPNSSAWLDAGFEALARTPLRAEEKLAAVLQVTGQSRWYGTVLAGYTERARREGLTDAEITEQEAALYDMVVTAEAYPKLREAIDADAFRSPADPFRFGLDRTLDGLAHYIENLESGEPHAAPQDVVELEDADVADDKRYRAAAKTTREAQKTLREAEKSLRQAEKELAQARKAQGQALEAARERAARG